MCDEIKGDLLKQLNNQRSILINKIVEDDLIENAVMPIVLWNQEDDNDAYDSKSFDRIKDAMPIRIYVNTSGGAADALGGLLGVMQSSKTPIITIGLGKCFSAGFWIVASGHIRMCYKNTQFMYHQSKYGMYGEHQSHIENVDYSDNLQNMFEQIILDKTKITKKKLTEVKEKKIDWYMLPPEALKLKVIDYIIGA